MIIERGRIAFTTDIPRFAWTGLRKFHNTTYVSKLLVEAHKLPNKQHDNARKQANQIRFCLMQAQEYYDAAKSVSLVTQPVLLYYSLMNLALAQILFKGTGDASLDRAREKNAHHGLQLKIDPSTSKNVSGMDILSKLAARAVTNGRSGSRFGTFELWLDSAREHPIISEIIRYSSTSSSVIYHAPIGAVRDARFAISFEEMNLLSCIQKLPSLHNVCLDNELGPDTIRGKVQTQMHDYASEMLINIIIHPSNKEKFAEFLSHIIVAPAQLPKLTISNKLSHGEITIRSSYTDLTQYSLPSGQALNKDDILFWPCDQPLNEFGFFYVALFIVGSYARYYPDYWIRDIENSAASILMITELIHSAQERVPLLALAELERCSIIISQ